MKKYNSDRVKSFKEIYSNNIINYYQSSSSNKLSFDELDEDNLFSDKESEECDNNETNNLYIISYPDKKKKKNSKVSAGVIPVKDEFFSKALLSILGEENKDIISPIKDDYYAGINRKLHINNFNIKDEIKPKSNLNKIPFKTQISCNINDHKNLKVNFMEVKEKRSSLMPKFQFRKKNKHVTFTPNKIIREEVSQEKALRYSDSYKKLQKKVIIDD